MHLAEAMLPREEAIRLARSEMKHMLARNARYYDRVPDLRPDLERPLLHAIRSDDTWYFIPFARAREGAEPLLVRVNGVTRVVVVDRSF
jgi:hypothetical protein